MTHRLYDITSRRTNRRLSRAIPSKRYISRSGGTDIRYRTPLVIVIVRKMLSQILRS